MSAARSHRARGANRRRHWEGVYGEREETELSWHQERPNLSLRLIHRAAPPPARVIDIGGGTSRLGPELVRAGYPSVTVVDIAPSALTRGRARAGSEAGRIRWIAADVTERQRLPRSDVWHDRALFHFLTEPEDRRHYVDLAARTVRPGGHLIVATFAPDGPTECSGLPTQRYGRDELAQAFGPRFELRRLVRDRHRTPWGAVQPFTFAVLQRTTGRPPRQGAPSDPRSRSRPGRARSTRSTGAPAAAARPRPLRPPGPR